METRAHPQHFRTYRGQPRQRRTSDLRRRGFPRQCTFVRCSRHDWDHQPCRARPIKPLRMAVIRARQSYPMRRIIDSARIHTYIQLTTTRLPDVELKVDYDQLATSTHGDCTTARTTYGITSFWKWRRSSIMRS